MERIDTPEGRRLLVSREMGVPASQAWDLLTDPDRWAAWGPSVTAVDCGDRRIEAGSTGRVRLPGGLWLSFEITHCQPPGEGVGRWGWDVARLPATGHRVAPRENGCLVGFEIPLLGAGYALVCRRALSNIESMLVDGCEDG